MSPDRPPVAEQDGRRAWKIGAAAATGMAALYLVAERRTREPVTVPPGASTSPHPEPTHATTPAREAWISWLRVAAIVGVILIHVGGPTAVAAEPGSAVVHLGVALDFSSRWCVPVFVMISGALLLDPARYRGDGDFLRRRALRLVPALVFWHVAYLVYRLAIAGDDLTLREATRDVFTGRLYTALYFFWIIVGLALITPLLVPWVARASRRAQLVAGAVLCAIPAAMVSTAPFRGTFWEDDFAWTETAITWFIPYLGFYLLGFALRGVVLRRWWLLGGIAAVVLGAALLSWQWGDTEGLSGWLEQHQPAEAYYSVTLTLLAPLVFLCVQGLVNPGGLLRVLSRGRPARLGAALGVTTLGVFGGHLLVFRAMLELDWIGGAPAATSVTQLLARAAFVVVVTYVLALLAARVPLLRRVV